MDGENGLNRNVVFDFAAARGGKLLSFSDPRV